MVAAVAGITERNTETQPEEEKCIILLSFCGINHLFSEFHVSLISDNLSFHKQFDSGTSVKWKPDWFPDSNQETQCENYRTLETNYLDRGKKKHCNLFSFFVSFTFSHFTSRVG